MIWYKSFKKFFSWHLLPEEPVKIQSVIEIVIFLLLIIGLFSIFLKWNEVPVRHIQIFSEAMNYKNVYDHDSVHYRSYRIWKFQIPATDKIELIKDTTKIIVKQGYFNYDIVRNNDRWQSVTTNDAPDLMKNNICESFKNNYYPKYENRPLLWDSIEMNLPYYPSIFPKGRKKVLKPIYGIRNKDMSFYNANLNDTVNWFTYYGHDFPSAISDNTFSTNSTSKVTGLSGLFDSFFGNGTPMEMPKWGRLEDISQAYYNVEINSFSVDSIKLSFEFWGAVEFSKMTPEPDIVSMNYIEFNDVRKIEKIKQSGLNFHVEFKELEIRQQIRLFFITALLSGLITILLVFAILAVLTLNRHIGRFVVNYVKNKKEKNKKTEVNKDNENQIKDE